MLQSTLGRKAGEMGEDDSYAGIHLHEKNVTIVTTSSTVHCLNNVHNLFGGNTRASMLKYRNLSHPAAVKISIHTDNTKLHISTTNAIQAYKKWYQRSDCGD